MNIQNNQLAWYAIYTKPKLEDTVAVQLKNIGINVLSPKIKTKKYRQGCAISVIENLFPCYLFAEFNVLEQQRMVQYTRGVKYILGKNSPVEVSNKIINSIKRHIVDGFVKIKPRELEKGQPVYIKEGPLKGFSAIFEKQLQGPERVLLLLEEINARINIEACFIEKVHH